MCQQAWLIFAFFVEMGFCHVAQAGLELLSSSNPLALASQSARITGVSHHAWPFFFLLKVFYLCFYFVSRGLVPRLLRE